MDELPRKGEVATEFRALAGGISEEIFATIFPNINRVLNEYRENSESEHSQTTSGIRSIETSIGLLDSSFGDLNFQLSILKDNQKKSAQFLEAIAEKLTEDNNESLFDKLMDGLFGGGGKVKGGKGKPGANKGKGKTKGGGASKGRSSKPAAEPVTKPSAKYSPKIFAGVNLIAAAFAIYDAFSRVMSLDPADPDWNKKATQEVGSVITRFGAATVGAIAGGMLGSAAFPGIGTVAGLVAGLIAGSYTDKFFGDKIEEVTKNVIDKLWEMKKNQTATNIPTASKLASLGNPSSDIFTGNTIQKANQNATNNPASVIPNSPVETVEQNDVTVAKEIMFGARKMKFIGEKLLFINVTGMTNDKKSGFKFQTRQQNKTSQKVEELKDKAEGIEAGANPSATGGGVTPNSSISGSTTPGSGGGSGGGSTGSSGYNPTGAGVNVTGSAQEAMQFFLSKGWTQEQAAGIVGNLMVESGNFAPDVLSGRRRGDGGKAFGVAQWHPARQKIFQETYGKSIEQATFQEQLEFVHWELTDSKSAYKRAGDMLRGVNDAARAAELVDMHYEKSSGIHRYQRMNNAVGLMKNMPQQQPSSMQSSSISPNISPTPNAQNQTGSGKVDPKLEAAIKEALLSPVNKPNTTNTSTNPATNTPPAAPAASMVQPEPKTSGAELQKTSAEITSTPKENPEEIRESISKSVTLKKEYSGPGHYTDSASVEVSGGKDVSAKVRIIQQFSHQ